MRWRIRDLHDGIWLVLRAVWDRDQPLAPDVEVIASEQAARRIDAWLSEGWGGAADAAMLARVAAELGEEPDPCGDELSRARMKAAVRRALRDGRLLAVRAPLPAPCGGLGVESEPELPPAAPSAAASEPEPYDGYFQIVLAGSGAPAANVRYRIVRQDGEILEGRTDANGHTQAVPTAGAEVLKIMILDEDRDQVKVDAGEEAWSESDP